MLDKLTNLTIVRSVAVKWAGMPRPVVVRRNALRKGKTASRNRLHDGTA